MKIRFAAKKSSSFGYFLLISGLAIGFSAIGLPFLTVEKPGTTGLTISLIIALFSSGFFLWIWIDTSYSIDNEFLITRSGPMKWKIPVKDISYVRLNQKTIGGTWKPTLSWDCIEIRYHTYRSIYITPEQLDEFIHQLRALNDNIEIKEE